MLDCSIVKHVEWWKLTKSIDRKYKVYLRSFPGAKVKFMKGYVKPCIWEIDLDYVILNVGTNELNFELPPKQIAKSVISVAKNLKTDIRAISISSIISRKGNYDNKTMEINKELSKIYSKEKLFFLEHGNVNSTTNLNRSRFHLNCIVFEKLDKKFSNFMKNIGLSWRIFHEEYFMKNIGLSEASKRVMDLSFFSLHDQL